MAGQSLTQPLLLVANPGSSSRKYGLYEHDLTLRAELHVEVTDGHIACSIDDGKQRKDVPVAFTAVNEAAKYVEQLFRDHAAIKPGEHIGSVGLRIVAPSAFFMHDHIITPEVIAKLESLLDLAPLHITATLGELKIITEQFSDAVIVGVSDSAFHATKPSYAWNYGINIQDADRLDIKRFGYHGLSVAASIDVLWDRGKLPPKVIVCHLGSGSSVTAVYHGRSIDNSMGYTPLEGVIMATRSGTIDYGAVRALKMGLNMSDEQLETYLHTKGGLVGLGGSNDVRELLEREANGDHYANLALATMVHSIHKAIGQMLVTLNGADLLVFTGTIGERSATLRKRIVAHLEFTDFMLDGDENAACTAPENLTSIAQATKSRPVIVVPTNEALEIAKHVQRVVQ
ncbi:MAG: hypothetical protein WAQ25_03385 [Candidatus Saccharimonas sp.]